MWAAPASAEGLIYREDPAMSAVLEVGDRVGWNSEAGYVSGRIVRVHTRDFQWQGRTRHCSEDEPQYEIKSDKSDHIAVHKASALTRL